ncbi:hypothetical protein ABT063_26515 [Streptomyces sp. NPDC002838]|uniref:hypothetical protein n=1 Tax=Streptomyces sp. NPDC002838 TaxID=3154436 RepID=UPI0033183835
MFAVAAATCPSVGWDFTRVGTPDAMLMANVRWLAGYRPPRVHRPEFAARLVEVFADGCGLLAGARKVGDQIASGPKQALLRGTSRTTITAITATARQIEALLNPPVSL